MTFSVNPFRPFRVPVQGMVWSYHAWYLHWSMTLSLGVIFRWIKIVILCLSWAQWSWWPPPGHPCHRVNTMEQTEFGPSGAAEAALNMMEGRLCQAKMPPDSEAEKLWIFSVLCEAGSVLTTGPACDNVTSCAALSWIRTFAKFNNYGKGSCMYLYVP